MFSQKISQYLNCNRPIRWSLYWKSTIFQEVFWSNYLLTYLLTRGQVYTQYGLISKGPISKTSQISGFFKQWLVKFSKLSNNLFCSRFLSNPLVNFFNLSKSKLLLLHSNLLPLVFLSGYAQTFVSFFRFSLHCFNLKKLYICNKTGQK